MDNPDGTGSLKISRMTIESDSVSFDFEVYYLMLKERLYVAISSIELKLIDKR